MNAAGGPSARRPASFLAIDLGNSRCKACLFGPHDDEPRPLFDVPSHEALERLAGPDLGRLTHETRGAIASVARPELADALRARVSELLAAQVPLNPESGLELAVEHPETVGHDRLYAARGALALCAEPTIVVDAGTALTVNAVEPDGAGGGRFLGGAIAPGPDLLADVLAARGARLRRVEPRPRAAALGRHTEAALEAGIGVGFEGAALHLVARLAAEAGFAAPRVVLTGGRRAFLAHLALGAGGARALEVEHLVQRGLFAAVAAAEASA